MTFYNYLKDKVSLCAPLQFYFLCSIKKMYSICLFNYITCYETIVFNKVKSITTNPPTFIINLIMAHI